MTHDRIAQLHPACRCRIPQRPVRGARACRCRIPQRPARGARACRRFIPQRPDRGARTGTRTPPRRGARLLTWTLSLSALALALLLPLAALAADASYAVAGAKPAASLMWTFYIIGGLTVIGAVLTITRRNPVVAAVCLVGTLAGTAGLYLLLHATFLAAMQVLVYAGAIMVLFVFVVMAVDRPEEEEILGRSYLNLIVAVGVVAVLFLRLFPLLAGPDVKQTTAVVGKSFGTVESIGRLLFSDYLFPFEALSLLLLVAIVGAVVITRHASRTARQSD